LSFIAATTPSAYVKKIIKSERKKRQLERVQTRSLSALALPPLQVRACVCVVTKSFHSSIKPLRRQIFEYKLLYYHNNSLLRRIFSGKSFGPISQFHQIPGGPLFSSAVRAAPFIFHHKSRRN
jgi:hypothetical protein